MKTPMLLLVLFLALGYAPPVWGQRCGISQHDFNETADQRYRAEHAQRQGFADPVLFRFLERTATGEFKSKGSAQLSVSACGCALYPSRAGNGFLIAGLGCNATTNFYFYTRDFEPVLSAGDIFPGLDLKEDTTDIVRPEQITSDDYTVTIRLETRTGGRSYQVFLPLAAVPDPALTERLAGLLGLSGPLPATPEDLEAALEQLAAEQPEPDRFEELRSLRALADQISLQDPLPHLEMLVHLQFYPNEGVAAAARSNLQGLLPVDLGPEELRSWVDKHRSRLEWNQGQQRYQLKAEDKLPD